METNDKLLSDALDMVTALLEDVNVNVADPDWALCINICEANGLLARAGRPSTQCGESDCGICKEAEAARAAK